MEEVIWTAQPDPGTWVQREFEFYQERRKRPVSLRGFAKTIGLAPGPLCEILRGKRPVTERLAEKISQGLQYSPEKKSLFLELVHKKHLERRTGLPRKKLAATGLKYFDSSKLSEQITDLEIRLLGLLVATGFKWNRKWISDRLGVSLEQVSEGINTLLAKQVLKTTPEGLTLACRGLVVKSDEISEVNGEAKGLENTYTAYLAIDAARREEAEKWILRFITTFSLRLGASEPASEKEIYHLDLSFKPYKRENESQCDN